MMVLTQVLKHRTAEQTAAHNAGTPLTNANSTSGTNGTSSTTNTSSSSSSAAASAGTITANDFLTLLVTELQNQDPTANTDPNQYINQLVQINSLEQLVSINQTLTTDLGGLTSTTSSSGNGTSTNGTAAVSTSQGATTKTALAPLTASQKLGVFSSSAGSAAPTTSPAGNLSIPSTSPAAKQVAQALTEPVHATRRGSYLLP